MVEGDVPTLNDDSVQNEPREPVKPESSEIIRKKCRCVLSVLKANLKESELKVVCYGAACNRGLVKPFPFHLADETDNGLRTLRSLNRNIIKLGILRHYLENDRRFIVEEPIINLLYWLLCVLQKSCRLQLVPESPRAYKTIYALVTDTIDLFPPSECFKLKFWSRSTENLQWEELLQNATKGTGFAFLTTQVEQLHALIHLGVATLVKTDKDLEPGLELTSNLEECLEATHPQWVWGKNSIGLQIKIVTLVEFIQDHVKTFENEGNSLCGTKYFANSKAVRPRFLLVYNQPSPKVSPPNLPIITTTTSSSFRDNLIYHLPCIFAYLSIGLFLVKQTEFWHKLSLNGARSTLESWSHHW